MTSHNCSPTSPGEIPSPSYSEAARIRSPGIRALSPPVVPKLRPFYPHVRSSLIFHHPSMAFWVGGDVDLLSYASCPPTAVATTTAAS